MKSIDSFWRRIIEKSEGSGHLESAPTLRHESWYSRAVLGEGAMFPAVSEWCWEDLVTMVGGRSVAKGEIIERSPRRESGMSSVHVVARTVTGSVRLEGLLRSSLK